MALATLPTRFEALTLDNPDAFEAMSNPLIDRPVKVPTEVMLGWAATVTLWAVGTVETFEPFMLDRPEALEATSNPLIVKPVKVPTEVMLGCDACATTLACGTLP